MTEITDEEIEYEEETAEEETPSSSQRAPREPNTDPVTVGFKKLRELRYEDGRRLAVAESVPELGSEVKWTKERLTKFAGLVCTLRGKHNG